MRLDARLHHEFLEQRLRVLHAGLVLALGGPDRAQLADEFLHHGKSCRHGRSYSCSGSPSTVQRRRSRRSSFGKSVRAWMVQRLSHIRKSPSFQTCSKMNSRRSPIAEDSSTRASASAWVTHAI